MKNFIRTASMVMCVALAGCNSMPGKKPSEAITPAPTVTPKQLDKLASDKPVAIHASFYKVKLVDEKAANVDWGLEGKSGLKPSKSSPVIAVISPYKGATTQVLRVDKSFSEGEVLDYLSKQGTAHLEHDSTVYTLDGSSAHLSRIQCDKTGKFITPGVETNTFQPNVIDQSKIWLGIKGNFLTTVLEPKQCDEKERIGHWPSLSEGSFFANALILTDSEAIVISGIPDPTREKNGENEISVIVLRMKVLE